MPEVSLPEWNSFIRRCPDAHLLQTGEWGELKSSFGWEAVRIIHEDTGAQLLLRKLPLRLSVGYIPKGPISIAGRAVRQDSFFSEVDAACKKRHAVFCKIEPDAWDNTSVPPEPGPGHKVSLHNIQPPRTIVIDVRGSEDDILQRMKQKTRYNIRLAEKKDVTVRPWNDLDGFHSMVQLTGGRDGFGVHAREYYRRAYELFHASGLCELLVAEYQNKALAALMVFAHGRRAWYIYGASNDEERNRMPTYLLQWEAMRWARRRGCEEYDMWGIPNEEEEILEANFENRHDGLWGVYRFKRGFGGELRRAAQAVDRIYNPALYRLYLWRIAGREAD